ncbi:alpha/beta fold hydrolase [Rhodopila sp.]|uniref:alpha/beta fold hydrolase n=1 Tax=Rhodopila sp. TaxID=2480087 RepID=UPI003D0EC213
MKLLTVMLLLAAAILIGGGIWLYTPDRPRAPLEAKYAGRESEFLQIAGLRLHVRDTGPRNAPAVILLHGLGSSLHTWEPWARALSQRFRVIRYDLPGFGLTGADPTGDYSDARGMAVLAALMDALAVPQASLVGNSMGGKLAWMFAAEHPARVDKLVLISPDGFASPGFEYGKQAEVPLIARVLPYTLPRFMLRMNLVPAYGDPSLLTNAVVDRYRDLMLAPGVRRALLARTAQVRLEPPEPLLRRIKAPTLLIWGEKDALIPPGNAQDYLRAIPNSRLVTFTGLGHVPQEEAPDRSLVPVEAFLTQQDWGFAGVNAPPQAVP